MLLHWVSAALAATGIGGSAGVIAGGPGAGAVLYAVHSADRAYVAADLTLAGHLRSDGSGGPAVLLPSAMAAAPFGGRVACGPAARVDAVIGGATEQGDSIGFGTRYASVLDDPVLVAAYPSAGVAVRATTDGGAEGLASLTVGLPFFVFDLYWPTVPTTGLAWTTPTGWRFGARATRYRATLEVGRDL